MTHEQDEALATADRIGVLKPRPPGAGRADGGAVRAAGDAVRGGIPGGGEPARRAVRVVESCAYRGTVLDVALRLEDGTALRASQALGEGVGRVPAVGERVRAGWRSEAGILLDG